MYFVSSLPSIWSLGLHVCRRTSDDFEDFAKNLEDLVATKIPFDTDCISENLLYKDLTALPGLIDKLNQNGEILFKRQRKSVIDFHKSAGTNWVWLHSSKTPPISSGQYYNHATIVAKIVIRIG